MASQALAGQSSASFDAKKIFPTPNFEDKIVVEVLSRKLENYVELAYGTAHPDTTLFPNHQLTLQVEQTEEQIVRYYAAPRLTQDDDNYDISYSGESNDHPIYKRDYIIKRSEYAVLAKLTPDPDHADALLVKEDMIEETGDGRINSLYVLVRRFYETLAGPWLVSEQYDKESDVMIVISRRRNVRANITEGITRSTDLMVTIIESEAIDFELAWEVKTEIPQATAHDLASALNSMRTEPKRFPATLDTVMWAYTNTVIGFNPAFVRDEVPHYFKTYWVISDDAPDIESLLDGRMALGTIYKLFGQDLGEVIYDAVDIFYPILATTVSYPGSSPDLTTFLADWVGGDPRCVDGKVERAGSKYRYKITLTFVKFLYPVVGTLPP